MHLTIQKKEVLTAAKTVKFIAKARATYATSLAYLSVSDRSLVIECDARDLSFNGSLKANITEIGHLSVDPSEFFSAVNSLPTGEITIKSNGSYLVLSNSTSNRKMLTHGTKDTPSNIIKGDLLQKIPSKYLTYLLDSTIYAASKDEYRSISNVCLEVNGFRLKATGTDGIRLAHSYLRNPQEDTREKKLLLPRKSAVELNRFLKSCKEKYCNLYTTDDKLTVTTEKYTLSVRLSNDNFPDYEQVIPESSNYKVSVKRNLILQTLKKLANKYYTILKLELSNNSLTLSLDGRSSESSIKIDYHNDPKSVTLNGSLLKEAITHLKGDMLTISLSGELDPILIEQHSTNSCAVIMPIRP